ncbi:hypothetical protein MMC25_001656 [Agyrium rufum]|nr:hypothetical protein [Agyrium rufum]
MASLNDLQLASDDIDFLQDSTGLTPRYLFRTYSESSAGKNGPGEFFSATYASGIGHQSFFTIPPSKAKQMLDEHVRWFNMPNDEFISWSSSILFVLQHAVRKKAYHKDKDIHLCILDTHQMDCTFYTAVTLLRFYNVPSVGGCRYEGLAAEYLAHEQIVRKGSNSLSAVSFNHLVSRGLYEILPQLTDEMGKLNLAKTLVNLRYSFRHPIELSVQTVEYAKIFAYCFAPEFFFHVFASILGCRARFRGDRTLLWELQQGLPGIAQYS